MSGRECLGCGLESCNGCGALPLLVGLSGDGNLDDEIDFAIDWRRDSLEREVRRLAADLAGALEREQATREQLMRVGLLAVSDRVDGCVPAAVAIRIRTIAHATCWPGDDPALAATTQPEGEDAA